MMRIEASYTIAKKGLNSYLKFKKESYLGMVYRYKQRKSEKQDQESKYVEHIEDTNPEKKRERKKREKGARTNSSSN